MDERAGRAIFPGREQMDRRGNRAAVPTVEQVDERGNRTAIATGQSVDARRTQAHASGHFAGTARLATFAEGLIAKGCPDLFRAHDPLCRR